jgi:hypothetical protein
MSLALAAGWALITAAGLLGLAAVDHRAVVPALTTAAFILAAAALVAAVLLP